MLPKGEVWGEEVVIKLYPVQTKYAHRARAFHAKSPIFFFNFPSFTEKKAFQTD